MIHKEATTNLSKAAAMQRCEEARATPGAVVRMIEQDDDKWTVTIVWDDTGAAVPPDAADGFDPGDAKAAAAAPAPPRH